MKAHQLFAAGALAALTSLTVFAIAAPRQDDRAQLLQAIDGFAAACDAGDIDASLPPYADDLNKPGQGRAAETKTDVAARLRVLFARYNRHLEAGIDEIETFGDLANARGRIKIQLTPKPAALACASNGVRWKSGASAKATGSPSAHWTTKARSSGSR
ncbi:MAG: hypothetical protein HY302_05470 [Opitutae bacterium]|nr:hypothetical protein [Opitutae bacterium]